MGTISIRQCQSLATIPSLSLRKQRGLQEYWNRRLLDPLVFVPSDELERGVDEQVATEQNVRLGSFAARYFSETISQKTTARTRARRLAERRIIVAVGFGKGYDSEWLAAAHSAGFQTWWIDVSDYACELARESLGKQQEQISHSAQSPLEPVVVCGEIQSILADPESVGLDLGRVSFWYFCRLLGCLSKPSFRAVLQQVGWESLASDGDPYRSNAVVIINAMKDYNAHFASQTSLLHTQRSLTKNLTIGAGRRVEIINDQHHQYFTKTVTAMTCVAASESIS
ncbi:MAG: hypothetical protein A2664_02955 [Candidatus Taylorbacteria bacterium RIFCSPHIGHO2_01_FULL_46_22b]|uniref:S-adenosyl-L-methionine-dependent methyltransferase n=1 Tax=Candidatus Taylorbacteria bacterium RIFCSPHIGHO2_01_FULL_46_22b TaxID=1802301 RepID=A0A1G2M690_9BACT|nr:MAG: hypothetical protein A2664_02955 [Candidatus Taylorbacteria bacterium RIFCSPHIGHO2_01_FULL_46_22b]